MLELGNPNLPLGGKLLERNVRLDILLNCLGENFVSRVTQLNIKILVASIVSGKTIMLQAAGIKIS